MKKNVPVIVFLLVCLFPVMGMGGEDEVKILKFYTDPVYVYDSADSSTKVSRKSLPDPKKVNLIIQNYDRRGLVMFMHEGREIWVNQAAVKLDNRAVASIVCTDPQILSDAGKGEYTAPTGKVYSQMGLGEGCK